MIYLIYYTNVYDIFNILRKYMIYLIYYINIFGILQYFNNIFGILHYYINILVILPVIFMNYTIQMNFLRGCQIVFR